LRMNWVGEGSADIVIWVPTIHIAHHTRLLRYGP
jgi:hypothetical protein